MSSQPDQNSKYGWREIARQGQPTRPAKERVFDFHEISGCYDEATAREQASRCIQCPNPACVGGCPLCNPIPEWMALTAEGRFLEAATILEAATNLADICVRLCPNERLCEETCLLNGVSDPVAIADIEQFLTQYAVTHGLADTSTPPPNGLRVAVIGSGPGGLACAEALAGHGFAVTVFDSSLVPGGLLVNGMPPFKLEKSVVERRLETLRKRGVSFELGMTLGKELGLQDLRSRFDAVYLGFDSRLARPLEIPGAHLSGVVQGMALLLQRRAPAPLDLGPIELKNQRVLVIGGGDTAMYCLRTALRSGARETVCLYRREAQDMPCTPHDYQQALEEGAQFIFHAAPVEILGNAAGHVRSLRALRTEMGESLPGAGRPFKAKAGSEFEIEIDWVVAALGFMPQPCIHSGDFSSLAVNDWGGLVVDDNQMTNIPGVYAGGDIVRGPCLALHAVRDARRAASCIHAAHSKCASA